MAIDQQLYDECSRLCLEAPLYSKEANVEINKNKLSWVIRHQNFQFDTYCIFCMKQSTFRSSKRQNFGEDLQALYKFDIIRPNIIPIVFRCQRVNDHSYFYLFDTYDDFLVKIGQSPSMETIAASDLARFRPILGKEYFSELHRAGGLMSHGIGIGAFVYLRRIFERLITTHREVYESQHGAIGGFDGLRMEEKNRCA